MLKEPHLQFDAAGRSITVSIDEIVASTPAQYLARPALLPTPERVALIETSHPAFAGSPVYYCFTDDNGALVRELLPDDTSIACYYVNNAFPTAHIIHRDMLDKLLGDRDMRTDGVQLANYPPLDRDTLLAVDATTRRSNARQTLAQRQGAGRDADVTPYTPRTTAANVCDHFRLQF